ncbi:MAG: 2-oxo acid dehydrogenase subunit E2 [Bryobacter sp.]|jgi:pyruvate dehydrogenase E2 component (dihydrolipoamide acetyltransferase)|nr:2-oxo acid dehydrogenase subunit E2 [Bryobacter sp. CoA8 C33]
MAIEITIPRLGWDMQEGTFAGWLKKPGEMVEAGEPLFALESDKVTMEVESLDGGRLHYEAGRPGEGAVVTVGQLIGYLLAPGEEAPGGEGLRETTQRETVAEAAPETRRSEPGRARAGRTPVTPRARRLAAALGMDPLTAQPGGAGGRIREQDIRAVQAMRPAVVAGGEGEGQGLTAARRAIAMHLMESRNNTVPVTLTTRAEATEVLGLRKRTGASFTAILAVLTAAAIERHPLIASRWDLDRIVPAGSIDIGIAVDTPRGLLVPVLRNVPSLELGEASRQARELIELARSGRASAAQLRGSVFTISNLGGYDVDAFTPVIHYPEAAILGVGAIRREAVVLPSGAFAACERMTLSLTFDHRILDGAPAARFLQTLKGLIEDPRGCRAGRG